MPPCPTAPPHPATRPPTAACRRLQDCEWDNAAARCSSISKPADFHDIAVEKLLCADGKMQDIVQCGVVRRTSRTLLCWAARGGQGEAVAEPHRARRRHGHGADAMACPLGHSTLPPARPSLQLARAGDTVSEDACNTSPIGCKVSAVIYPPPPPARARPLLAGGVNSMTGRQPAAARARSDRSVSRNWCPWRPKRAAGCPRGPA